MTVERIHEHQTLDPIRMRECVIDDYRATGVVTDEDDPFEIERVEHGDEVLAGRDGCRCIVGSTA